MRLRISSILFAVLVPFSVMAAVATATPPKKSIPILVYHHLRVSPSKNKSTWTWKMSVAPKAFEKQMQWIKDHGYQTVSLGEANGILRGTVTGPEKPVVITFDDNNLTAYTVGLPTLLKHKLTATYFLVTNRLGNKAFIGSTEAVDLVAKGMDVQSHSVTHATMTNLSVKKLDGELSESRATLEALTGKPVQVIAYPSTMQNKAVRDRARAAGYTVGVIMDPRRATAKDDPLKLPRIMMTDDTNLKNILP